MSDETPLTDKVVDAFLTTASPSDPERVNRIRQRFVEKLHALKSLAPSSDPHLGHTVDTSHVRAPTGPDPEHTRFVVLLCSCGEVDFFPRVNYVLALPEWRETFERTLRSHGLTIAKPEP